MSQFTCIPLSSQRQITQRKHLPSLKVSSLLVLVFDILPPPSKTETPTDADLPFASLTTSLHKLSYTVRGSGLILTGTWMTGLIPSTFGRTVLQRAYIGPGLYLPPENRYGLG